MTYNDRLEIRLTAEQKQLIAEAAYLRRVSVNEWARKVLAATATKTIEESK